MLQQPNNFQAYYNMFQEIPENMKAHARNMATLNLEEDDDLEEIGSSDISYVLYDWLGKCESPMEMIETLIKISKDLGY